MNSNPLLTRTHFERALTPEHLRVTLIIRITLVMGVVAFFLAVLLIDYLRTPDSPIDPDPTLLTIMSAFHAAFAIAAFSMGFFLSNMRLNKNHIIAEAVANTPEQIAEYAVNSHRVSTILLMAPMEGASFFGLVVCLLAVTNGTISMYPLLWFNAASAGAMVFYAIITFPTRERVLATLERVFSHQ